MKSIGYRLFDRQIKYVVAIIALVLAVMVPVIASAATVTERSIELSSSSVSMSNVTYKVNFKAVQDAGAFVVDFCSNSPIIGFTCTPASDDGFSAVTAASTTAGFTDVTGSASKVIVAGDIDVDVKDEVSVDITGIKNPATAGPLYARIVTFDNKTSAQAYTSTAPGSESVRRDEGGVAISITPTVGVSGMVLESLTFCVAKNAIGANCDLTGNEAPTLQLGEVQGDGSVALIPTQLSEGTIHTQISTNAASGAVVRLKSDATGCGGLIRAGAPTTTCDIGPALNADIVDGANEAKFGVKTAAATDIGTNPIGVFKPAENSIYSNTAYAFNYVTNDTAGVTSPFGDPFLDTGGEPVTGKNMQLTFGVIVSNSTPAGLYSTDLNMIAVGKF